MVFLLLSFGIVFLYKYVNPPTTVLMLQKGTKVDREWVDIEDISPDLVLAVVSSEDNLFLEHNGFDIEAIKKAQEHNKTSKHKRGASTISQQTAKNVFLWPARSWLRKGMEVYFTALMELLWSKERIMEVYLNVIEMGDGIYGAEAAAKHYYGRSAKKLNREQCAMIAAILPNPRERNPTRPTTYLLKRKNWILWNMKNIEVVKFD